MSEKSALRLIPGKDALLEYQPIVYKPKTYVEYQGLVYKSLIDTTATFVPSEWELISDLREVRVRTIGDRNALTGSTPTTGTTGIHIPILDNTNVLVLHAQADPQVAADKFARYNYNKTTNSFLLLQVSTGSTGSNVSDYNLLTNKPPIISGITANAGAGLTGGGIFSGGVPPNRTTFTFAHADTSSQANINSTGLTYVQKLKFDTFGHVTGATSSTWIHPDTSSQPAVNGSGFTYIQSIGVDTDGHITSVGQSTWIHPDTSSQGDVINSGSTVIQSITLDTDGHVTGINSATVSTGGGGVNFSVNGNTGGVQAMPNGGTLQITGGTNITTVSSLHGANVGVRISLVPAGVANQIQINNGTALTAFSNLTFTGGTTLVTNKLSLSGVPVTGATTNDFLLRNVTSGAINRMSFASLRSTLVGTPINSIQYNGGGLFAGDGAWLFDTNNKAVTLGVRSGATGQYSLAVGNNANASGQYSTSFGLQTKASSPYSHAEGYFTIASGTFGAHAEGNQTVASGSLAHAEGAFAFATGIGSHAQNRFTTASGDSSHAGGYGQNQTVIAGGLSSFNHSYNSNSQIVGSGALSNYSVILGGQDHNIAVGNTAAVILGGNAIKLTGTTYINTVAVPNLAIMSLPVTGIGSDNVLVRNSVTGIIKQVTQASLAGATTSPAGANGYVQFRNNSAAFGASANFIFVTGSSTLQIPNLNISALPTSGNTGNALLTRNPGTGNIERFAISNLPGLPLNSVQYNNGSGFGGNSKFIFDAFNTSLLLGAKTGSSTQFSLNVGTNNGASNYSIINGDSNSVFNNGGSFIYMFGAGNKALDSLTYKFIYGINNKLSGNYGSVFGNANSVSGSSASAFGLQNIAVGGNSFVVGTQNITNGSSSFAMGALTKANGISSFAGGTGISGTRVILANANYSFNFSQNTFSQNPGDGALGTASAILGGQNHTANGANSIVLGGTFNKITGSTSQTAIIAGNGHFISGNTTINSVIVGGNVNKMSGNNNGMLGGNTNQILTGQNNAIIGGNANKITGSTQYNTILGGQNNVVGNNGFYSSILGGNINTVNGNAFSIIASVSSSITGISSQNNVILAGNANKINNGINGSVIIGGQNIILTGSSQSNQAVAPNLMIWNTPGAGATDDVLTWNSVTRKIRKVTQASISDERLKKNLIPLDNVVEKINKLSTVEFKYNEKNESSLIDKSDYGLIAQEVENIFPFVVNDNLIIDDVDYKTIDYKKLVPVLFAAIKELNEKIKNLESKIK